VTTTNLDDVCDASGSRAWWDDWPIAARGYPERALDLAEAAGAHAIDGRKDGES
jgi:hypothetical protein